MTSSTVDWLAQIQYAISLCDDTRYAKDSQRAYFGLTGGLKLVEQIPEETLQYSAETLVLAHFIKDRSPELYEKIERDVQKKLREAKKGKRQEQLQQFARQVEDITRKERLEKIIEKYRLQPTTIGTKKIYLPEIESNVGVIRAQAHNEAMEYMEDIYGLENFICAVEDEVEELAQESSQKTAQIPETFERFTNTMSNYAMIEFLRIHENTEFEDFSDVLLFNEIRANNIPAIEYAIRLQIKEDPSIGTMLDEEFNRLSLTIHSVLKEKESESLKVGNPVIIHNNKLKRVPDAGNA